MSKTIPAARLVVAITVINSCNLLNITTRLEPGHYEPGQFDGRAVAARPDRS